MQASALQTRDIEHPMPTFLTDRTVQSAEAVASQLHGALSKVLASPPLSGCKAATLATDLGVGRMTCQRIAKLSRLPADAEAPGAELLAELPGIAGLREFLNAARRAGSPRAELDEANTAVDAFESFLREVNLSQSRFASALALFHETTDNDLLRGRRERLFDAAAAVTGQSAEVTISMMAIAPTHEEEFNFKQIAVRGYTQMRASGSAMPIRLPINMAYSNFRNVTSEEAARQPQRLVESFCTRPLPSIDSRVIKSEHLAHIINPEHIPAGEPFDCFATQHNLWKITGPGKHKAIWLYVDYPTRHVTFDLHLHRSMEERNDLSGDCHLWGTSLLAPPEDLWMTRLADQVRFSRLGPGTSGSASKVYQRHQELTSHMFEFHGWDPDEFIGFRCEMDMPIWRSGLCVVLMER